MKMPRMPWTPKPIPKRTDYQNLVNEPVEVWVGGKNKSKPKKITIEEPSMIEVGKHLAMLATGVSEILRDNRPLLESLLSDKKIKFGREEFLQFTALPAAVRSIVADLVGETEDYVDQSMTAKQFTCIMEVYADLIGWEFIKETFSRALQNWKAAGNSEATVKPITPPEPVEPSSKSGVN